MEGKKRDNLASCRLREEIKRQLGKLSPMGGQKETTCKLSPIKKETTRRVVHLRMHREQVIRPWKVKITNRRSGIKN
jgi:hypothetical protein